MFARRSCVADSHAHALKTSSSAASNRRRRAELSPGWKVIIGVSSFVSSLFVEHVLPVQMCRIVV